MLNYSKMKKLVKSPNLFFYDYFKKKVNIPNAGKNNKIEVYTSRPKLSIPRKNNPWCYLAKKYNMLSGIRSGKIENNLCLNESDLIDFVFDLFDIAIFCNVRVKISPPKKPSILINKRKKYSDDRIKDIYYKINEENSLVIEIENIGLPTVAIEIFIYDVNAEQAALFRRNDVYIKKIALQSLNVAYKYPSWVEHKIWPDNLKK